MSASIYLYSEHDGPFRIAVGDDMTDSCIWIRDRRFLYSIALTLDASDRVSLRAALDELDAREAAQAQPALATAA